MKNSYKPLIIIAAAAMMITGCSKDNAEASAPDTRMANMTVVVSDQIENAPTTRTHYDEVTHKIQWDGSTESIYVVEQTAAIKHAQSTACSITNDKAAFSVAFPVLTGSSFSYSAVYPASSFIVENYTDITKIKALLPSEQKPLANSFDPTADLMMTLPAVETSQPTELSLRFGRIAALAKMTVNNLAFASGENIESVSFSATGKKLAGRSYLDLSTGKITELAYTNSSEKINLNFSDVTVANTAAVPVWFTCLPCDLTSGDTFTVIVTSDKSKSYTKAVTLTAAQSILFKAGDLASFSVDMSGISGVEITSGARLATLDYSEISSQNMGYDTPLEFTNAGGTWTVAAYKNSGMQINGSKGYIKLPIFTNAITTIEVTTASNSKTLMFCSTNTINAPIVSQVGNNSTTYILNVIGSGQEHTTGYLKSNGLMVITNIKVMTGAAILIADINDISATGVANATTTYATASFASSDDTAVTCDGTIVTAASVDNTTKTVTYTVSGNTTGAARKGSIKLTSAANEATTTINVAQLADVFEVSPSVITLSGDTGATATFSLASDYVVDSPVVSNPTKFSVSGPVDNVYTITALAEGGAAEAELGTVTIIRNVDNKEVAVTVKQAAKGATGGVPIGTILWSETWDGGAANDTPLTYMGKAHAGTTVFQDAVVAYAQSSSSTKLYAEKVAGGTSPELLLAKSSGTWTITGIPIKDVSKIQLALKSNKALSNFTSITYSVDGGTPTAFTQASYATSLLTLEPAAVNGTTLTIVFTGNSSTTNIRIDEISLVVGE